MARVLRFTEFCERILSLTLTTAQRTLAKVAFDGVDPVDLEGEEREISRDMFGGIERIPSTARDGIVVFRLGRSSGKSIVCAAYAVYKMCTADLDQCGPGDVPAVAIISPRKETSKIIVGYGRSMSESSAIKPLVIASSAYGFTIRRLDGREVQFVATPKSRGGNAVRGFSLIVVVVDESEFVPSAGADATISDEDIIDAVMPRLLDGGALVLASTPWPAPSATGRTFDENFGKPTTALAARSSTLVMRAGDAAIAKRVEKEMLRKPANARREYFCELVDGGGGAFFERSTLDHAIMAHTFTPTKIRASAGVDTAFVNDSSALVVVERAAFGTGVSHPGMAPPPSTLQMVVVTCLELRSPEPQRPLIPSEVISEFALLAREFGCQLFAADSHQVKTVRRIAATVGVQVYDSPATEIHLEYLREVFREGKIKIPNDPALIAQLKSVRFKPRTGGGLTIILPRSKDSGHADLVSALGQAVWLDRRYGPLFLPDGGGGYGGAGVKGPALFPGL